MCSSSKSKLKETPGLFSTQIAAGGQLECIPDRSRDIQSSIRKGLHSIQPWHHCRTMPPRDAEGDLRAQDNLARSRDDVVGAPLSCAIKFARRTNSHSAPRFPLARCTTRRESPPGFGTFRIVREPSFRKDLQMRSLAFAVAIGSMALLTSGSAGALPAAFVDSPAAAEANLLLVRDGCGRGMRFSNRLQACVEEFDRGPRRGPPPPFYVAPPPPRVIVPVCPPGQRFSNSRRACVWR